MGEARRRGRPAVSADAVKVVARVPGKWVEELDALAAERMLARADLLRECVRRYLAAEGVASAAG